MYSAVIVLANLMSAEGILNAESRARMDMAIDAVKAGEAPFLVTCGWAYREDLNLPIAYAMRDYALAAGVLSDRIIVEKNSRDTVGDAVFTHRNLAIPRSWDTQSSSNTVTKQSRTSCMMVAGTFSTNLALRVAQSRLFNWCM